MSVPVIVADAAIAYAEQAFGPLGELRLIPGAQINNKLLRDADVLLVRTVTRVNEALLAGTPVKFVGTATVGDDHVDREYLSERQIIFSSAQGANADAVAEYVLAAALGLCVGQDSLTDDMGPVGVVGYGNIGRRVAEKMEVLGISTRLCDTPLAASGTEPAPLEALKSLLSDCRILTLHVPLVHGGMFPTRGLLSAHKVAAFLQRGGVLINTSRGDVLELTHQQLKQVTQDRGRLVLDVWPGEPGIDLSLALNAARVAYATPHVAGYSLRGKINATKMIHQSLCWYLRKKPSWPESYEPLLGTQKNVTLDLAAHPSPLYALRSLLLALCDLEQETQRFREGLSREPSAVRQTFEQLRTSYALRRQAEDVSVALENRSAWPSSQVEQLVHCLQALEFNLATAGDGVVVFQGA